MGLFDRFRKSPVAGPAPQPVAGGQQPVVPPPALSSGQVKHLKSIKNSTFLKIVENTNTISEPRKEVGDQPAWYKNTEGRVDHGLTFGDRISEYGGGAISTVGDIIDAAGELPFVGGIVAMIQSAWSLVKTGVDICRNWNEKKGHKERWVIAKDIMLQLGNMVSGAWSVYNDNYAIVKSVENGIPIVGAVIGAILSGIGFCTGVYHGVKATIKSIGMDKQQAALGVTTSSTTPKAQVQDAKTGKMRTRRDDETNQDEREESLAKIEELKRRQRIHRASSPAGQDIQKEIDAEMVHLAEIEQHQEADVVKELGSANIKRGRRGILEMVTEGMNIAGSLASIDPTYGKIVGLSLSAISLGTNTAVKGGNWARQRFRNRGWLGTNVNKSSSNKEVRRHHLAVSLYRNMKDLNKLGLRAMEPASINTTETVDKASSSINRFRDVKSRVDAMDINIHPMVAASSGDAVVDMLRKGFYRESS